MSVLWVLSLQRHSNYRVLFGSSDDVLGARSDRPWWESGSSYDWDISLLLSHSSALGFSPILCI